MSAQDALDRPQIDAELESLPHWCVSQGALRTVLTCPTSAGALELFAAIGNLAQEANHHPDVDWRYDTLFLTLTSHDAGSKVSAKDVALARSISAAADVAGARARTELLRTVEIALDSDDPEAVSPMWQAALGYKKDADGALVDPFGRGPALWFQKTATPNANSFHLDITVPYVRSANTLRSVEDAGASLDHESAPRWVIATDVQGNRLCICTEEGRDA